MGEVADRWAARDKEPTHLQLHPPLHQETTNTQGVTDTADKPTTYSPLKLL
jgi:hypothetical protein